MAEQGRQKDAMDVLQAWVNDYNARARPEIPLGAAGEAGGTSRDSVGRSRAFLWKQGSGILDLRPSTGVNSSANDINEQGDIVGGGDTGFAAFHAYLLSEGTSVDLGTLGGNESEALAINRRGQVAGHSRIGGGGAPAKHAFFICEPGRMLDLGPPDGTMVDLGTLGGEHSSAAAVSEEAGGTIWIAGHSHDASAHLCAVRWAVRLRS